MAIEIKFTPDIDLAGWEKLLKAYCKETGLKPAKGCAVEPFLRWCIENGYAVEKFSMVPQKPPVEVQS